MKVLKSLLVKEFYQITRDPSTFLISFVMPIMLLLIYMYGVNMDTVKVVMGIKADDNSPEIANLLESFDEGHYVKSTIYQNKDEMYEDLIGTRLRAFILIPNDFILQLDRGQVATMAIVADGAEINLSKYAQSYAQSIAQGWLTSSPKYGYKVSPAPLNAQIRFWYNQDINSHYFILPGSIAITMTILGMLLTALVVSREWERGTMEALLATQIRKIDFILSKYIPYFVLGMSAMLFSVFVCVVIFKIPFRGSYFVLFTMSGLFLSNTLGIGLLISTQFKDQFLASQTALSVGFLPALFLSGLIYPIYSMPLIMQYVTVINPARYYVAYIQSEFMSGTIWEIVIPNACFLGALGVLLFITVYKKTKMGLE